MNKKVKNKIEQFSIDFLIVFLGVLAAFALGNWGEQKKESKVELKILSEIKNGLDEDLADLDFNINGHKKGLAANYFFSSLINGNQPKVDSLAQFYTDLLNDFIPVQNLSGYETLKSRGLEIIKNDSLRKEILSLYENDYNILRKREEEHEEFQFFRNYNADFKDFIVRNFELNSDGDVFVDYPLKLTEDEKDVLLINLWKIRHNRNFLLNNYKEVKGKIIQLQNHIKKEQKR